MIHTDVQMLIKMLMQVICMTWNRVFWPEAFQSCFRTIALWPATLTDCRN